MKNPFKIIKNKIYMFYMNIMNDLVLGPDPEVKPVQVEPEVKVEEVEPKKVAKKPGRPKSTDSAKKPAAKKPVKKQS